MKNLQNQRLLQLIEQATSVELRAPNQALNESVVQEINSRADMSKEAAKLLKKKLSHENPKVIFMALMIIELAMQKCGNPFHVQIGTKEFMNSMVLLLHQKDLLPQVKNKALTLIQAWGKKFERERDILPLFFDVYQALQKKGIQFPGEQPGQSQAPKKAAAPSSPEKVIQPSSGYSKPKSSKKSVDDLSPKYRKIVQEMNLLKGNINFTNEIIDQCKTKQDLKENDTLVDLLKALKEMEEKLINLIQETVNEDILAILLMVNEDMNTTFARYKAIKNGGKAAPFVPGEYNNEINYLEPTHIYGQDKDLAKTKSAQKEADQGDLLLNMMGSSEDSSAKRKSGVDALSFDTHAFGTNFGSSNDPNSRLQDLLNSDSNQQPQPNVGNDPFGNDALGGFGMPQQQQPPQQFGMPPQQQFGTHQQQQNPFQSNMMGPGPQQPYPQQQQPDPFGGMNQFQTGAPAYGGAANPFATQQPMRPPPVMNRGPPGHNEPKVPSFLQNNPPMETSAEKIQNLKSLNANTFDLGVQGMVNTNPQPNPFSENAFNPSYQQQQQPDQGAQDFADLFNLGSKIIKDAPQEEREHRKNMSFSYNPVEMNPSSQAQPPRSQPPPVIKEEEVKKEQPKPAQTAPVQDDPFGFNQPPAQQQQQQEQDFANQFGGLNLDPPSNSAPKQEPAPSNDLFDFGAAVGDPPSNVVNQDISQIPQMEQNDVSKDQFGTYFDPFGETDPKDDANNSVAQPPPMDDFFGGGLPAQDPKEQQQNQNQSTNQSNDLFSF